jgi:hypothetical protein
VSHQQTPAPRTGLAPRSGTGRPLAVTRGQIAYLPSRGRAEQHVKFVPVTDKVG